MNPYRQNSLKKKEHLKCKHIESLRKIGEERYNRQISTKERWHIYDNSIKNALQSKHITRDKEFQIYMHQM